MDAPRLLQIARIPLLAGLLLAMGSAQYRAVPAISRLEYGALWPIWLLLVALAATFVAGALLGRGSRHPTATLAAEGLVAAALGVVPPVAWILALGMTWFTVRIVEPVAGAGFVQPLAIAWLVIAVMTGVRQARGLQPRSAAAGRPADISR